METATPSSDMGVGLSLAFGALGVLLSLGLYLAGTAGDQVTSGWAFAGAMAAATVLVSALHVYS